MTQQTILDSDYVSDALKTKVNNNDNDAYDIKDEVETARGSNASLDARLDALEAALSAATAGSSVPISAGDTSPGYLDGKALGTTEQITLTKGNAGANETLTWSIPDSFLMKYFLL